MQAIITSAEKQVLPRYNPETGIDEPTLQVVTTVDFVNDAGETVHTQSYAQLPEDVSKDYFQAQADAMQADIEHSKVQSALDASSKLADEKISELTNS